MTHFKNEDGKKPQSMIITRLRETTKEGNSQTLRSQPLSVGSQKQQKDDLKRLHRTVKFFCNN